MEHQDIDSRSRESEFSFNGTEPKTIDLESPDWNVRFVDICGAEGKITGTETVRYDGIFRDEIKAFLDKKLGKRLSDAGRTHLLLELYMALPLKEIEAQQTTVEEH